MKTQSIRGFPARDFPVRKNLKGLLRRRPRLVQNRLVRGLEYKAGYQSLSGRSPIDHNLLRHELRTPLSGILAMTDLLRHSGLVGEQLELLRTLKQSGLHLEELITRMCRPGSATLCEFPLDAKPVNGQYFMEQLIRAHWSGARDKGIGLYLVYDPRLSLHWQINTSVVRQILDNLLANGIKFTQQGYVLLEVRPANGVVHGQGKIEIQVSDTGIGISSSDDKRIYSVNEQGAGVEEQNYGGSGLGLYVCKHLAGVMGGSLEHQSAPGSGSCFKLVLPGLVSSNSESAYRFRPALLRGSKCLLALRQPAHRVVSCLLENIGVQFADLEEPLLMKFPEGTHCVICNSDHLHEQVFQSTHSARINKLLCLSPYLRPGFTRDRGIGDIGMVDLPSPILRSNLEPLLLQIAMRLRIVEAQGA